MKRRASLIAALALAFITTAARPGQPATTGWTITGWNNLGMHCMDADFSVFAILPPYNTIHAQVVDASGNLVTSAAGITVTYQAIADPTGSINTTSVGKDNFWTYAASLFGLAKPLPPDVGLTGVAMPGMMNQPQAMTFDPANDWFIAEGIPITPYDDAGHKNTYPMMRLVAKDSSGNVLATTDIVLPISDEMACGTCHASGGSSAARPIAGWVNDPDPIRDYRLNILRLHDDRQAGNSTYVTALSQVGYSSTGLYNTVTGGKPVLCAACHGSNALAGTGQAGIPQLTQAIHDYHAQVTDPVTSMTLDSSSNRSACYRCHPGSTTKCLRGAMGSAVAADGSMEMQCQSCHGPMHAVGAAGRQGWFDEPNCQSCHTGTAVRNNGQIRYTSALDASGQPRVPVDTTFATNPNTPAAGFSLYRFSTGHGGLQCAACHGSTHAEFPSSHPNDNIQSIELQGHKGMLVDCTTCHGSQSLTIGGGPHGMHPVGQSWVSSHGDAADDGRAAQCQACHGTDYRGTVLSRAQGDRTISAFGSKLFWKGFQVGCYTCHNGPGSESASSNPPATVSNASASTTAGTAVTIALSASDPNKNALTLRVVSQPANGTAGLSGTKATYYPDPSFTGTDTFTFAAWNGSTDSNLGTVTVTVAGGATCTVTAKATVPSTGTVGQALTFQGSASSQGCSNAVAYAWTFGDGSSSSQQNPTHAYAAANTYTWRLTVSSGSSTNSTSGTVMIAAAPTCTVTAGAVVPASATVGASIQFQGSATSQGCSNPVAYAWTFGDGSSSSQQNPTHAYAAANTFTWRLTVSSGSSSNSTSGTVTVTASPCTITAKATVPASGTAGSSIQFQGSATTQGCTGTLTYAWAFGDGSSSSQQNPTHGYGTANTYAWRLTASLGGSSNSVTGTITVASAPACSLFITGSVPTSAYVGQSVTFPLTVTSSGCGGSISYRWDFGDGSDGSRKAQPTHTYRSSGTYTWQLKASTGSTSASATGQISVSYKPRRNL